MVVVAVEIFQTIGLQPPVQPRRLGAAARHAIDIEDLLRGHLLCTNFGHKSSNERLQGVSRQAPPFSIIVRKIARPPRRPCADAERSVPSNDVNTFAAARPTPKTMAPAEASQPAAKDPAVDEMAAGTPAASRALI
jgi:hypothetical protein